MISQYQCCHGLNNCNGTGYNGRVGVYELLKVTDEIRDEIVNKASARELRATAIAQGMRTMQQEAFRLVTEGITTVEDVLRSVYAPGMDDKDEDSDRLGGPNSGQDRDDPIAPVTDGVDPADPIGPPPSKLTAAMSPLPAPRDVAGDAEATVEVPA